MPVWAVRCAGSDSVDYWGTEAAIDGGAGTNTLLLKSGAILDLSATDGGARTGQPAGAPLAAGDGAVRFV